MPNILIFNGLKFIEDPGNPGYPSHSLSGAGGDLVQNNFYYIASSGVLSPNPKLGSLRILNNTIHASITLPSGSSTPSSGIAFGHDINLYRRTSPATQLRTDQRFSSSSLDIWNSSYPNSFCFIDPNSAIAIIGDVNSDINHTKITVNDGYSSITADCGTFYINGQIVCTSDILVGNKFWYDSVNCRLGLGQFSSLPASLSFAASTIPSSGIYFGTDTNLYRNASGTLRTDTSVSVGRRIIVDSKSPSFASTLINTDATVGNLFTFTMSGARTLSVPSGGADGQRITYRVKQDSTGGRALTLQTGIPSGFRFGTDITSIDLTSEAPNKTSYISCIYNAADARWDVVSFVRGF